MRLLSPLSLVSIRMMLATLSVIAGAFWLAPTAPALAPGLSMAPNAAGGTASYGTSFNWSGYAATQGTFTSVAGTWTVPPITASGHAGADATWVGIGGVRTDDLIQSGTQDIISSSGQVSTTAFIEMLPRASQPIPVTVNVGDSVSVSIAQTSGNQWRISFVDNTTGQNYQTTRSYASSRSSAEWIEEAPSARDRVLPLASFGSVQFTGASTTLNGKLINISQAQARPIDLMNVGCQALATPTAVGGDGASFAVTRSSATSTPPMAELDRGVQGWRRVGRGAGVAPQAPQAGRTCVGLAPAPAPVAAAVPATVSNAAREVQRVVGLVTRILERLFH